MGRFAELDLYTYPRSIVFIIFITLNYVMISPCNFKQIPFFFAPIIKKCVKPMDTPPNRCNLLGMSNKRHGGALWKDNTKVWAWAHKGKGNSRANCSNWALDIRFSSANTNYQKWSSCLCNLSQDISQKSRTPSQFERLPESNKIKFKKLLVA